MEVNTKHSDVILDKLNRERNSNKKYCDFTLHVGTQDFSVHKCVLGAFSDFFDKMFTSEMRERYENKANMEGISAGIMGLILTFIYTSCITINNANVFELLFAAEYLQIKSLKESCIKFFKNCLDSENCLRIRSCCRQYNIKDVTEKADGFIAENLISVVKSEEFCDITLDDVTNILKLKSAKGSNEESKYNGLIAWMKRDVSERTKNFTKLFSLINLHLLSKEFMNDVMMKEELVFSSLDCVTTLLNVLLSSVPSTSTSKPADGANQVGFGSVLAIGGWACWKKCSIYDITTKKWNVLPDTIDSHAYASAVNVDQRIYLMGGLCVNTLNSVEMLNLQDAKPQWNNKLQPMMEGRYSFASAVLNGIIYSVGGYNNKILSTGKCYNPTLYAWNNISRMDKARCCHTLVSARGLLFAIGGKAEHDQITNTSECFDPNTRKWKFISSMKTKRRGLCSVVLNNEIYAIGGHDGNKYLYSVEKYNLDIETWSDVASMNEARIGAGACVVNGKIYVVGGNGAETIEVFDPVIDKWEEEGKMDMKRECPCILSV